MAQQARLASVRGDFSSAIASSSLPTVSATASPSHPPVSLGQPFDAALQATADQIQSLGHQEVMGAMEAAGLEVELEVETEMEVETEVEVDRQQARREDTQPADEGNGTSDGSWERDEDLDAEGEEEGNWNDTVMDGPADIEQEFALGRRVRHSMVNFIFVRI